MDRISRNDMFADIVNTVSKRSTCLKKQVGSVLIDDNRIIAIGYNGVLPNVDRKEGIDPITGETLTIHAEANIIAYCAKHGIKTDGCTIWVTLSPCRKCAELIIQAGIKRVVFMEQYRDIEPINLLIKHNIIIEHYIAV